MNRLLALALAAALAVSPQLAAQDAAINFRAENVGPRKMEPVTAQAIERDYTRAWQALARAFEENRAELLQQHFTGAALKKLAHGVGEQRQNGLRTRYLKRAHNVRVLFYSPEGLSVQLRDSAEYELQLLDGDNVIHSEPVRLDYIAVLTPTQVRWTVRVLESVPAHAAD